MLYKSQKGRTHHRHFALRNKHRLMLASAQKTTPHTSMLTFPSLCCPRPGTPIAFRCCTRARDAPAQNLPCRVFPAPGPSCNTMLVTLQTQVKSLGLGLAVKCVNVIKCWHWIRRAARGAPISRKPRIRAELDSTPFYRGSPCCLSSGASRGLALTRRLLVCAGLPAVLDGRRRPAQRAARLRPPQVPLCRVTRGPQARAQPHDDDNNDVRRSGRRRG